MKPDNITKPDDFSLTSQTRKQAWRHFKYQDHAALRAIWRNFSPVADGVFRASQPSPPQLADYEESGIRSVINLRGAGKTSFYMLELESCKKLGLNLYSLNFCPGGLPTKQSLLDLFDIFETADKPLLFHCKSGADRTGLAAVLYLIHFEGNTVQAARRHLHWRYLHVKSKRMGVFDHIVDQFEIAHKKTAIALIDWIKDHYDQKEMAHSYQMTLGRRK